MEPETNQLENEKDLTNVKPVKRNETWEANHALILKAMAKAVYD